MSAPMRCHPIKKVCSPNHHCKSIKNKSINMIEQMNAVEGKGIGDKLEEMREERKLKRKRGRGEDNGW